MCVGSLTMQVFGTQTDPGGQSLDAAQNAMHVPPVPEPKHTYPGGQSSTPRWQKMAGPTQTVSSSVVRAQAHPEITFSQMNMGVRQAMGPGGGLPARPYAGLLTVWIIGVAHTSPTPTAPCLTRRRLEIRFCSASTTPVASASVST